MRFPGWYRYKSTNLSRGGGGKFLIAQEIGNNNGFRERSRLGESIKERCEFVNLKSGLNVLQHLQTNKKDFYKWV